MPNYLLEIGTEELPSGFLPDAQNQLQELLSEALRSANLPFQSLKVMGTPRRLAVKVSGLAALQETTHQKKKGPRVDKAFDESGKPTTAASKFAEGNGLTVDQLDHEEIGGAKYLVANLTIKGLPAQEVLSELVPQVIAKITGERPMRWGSFDMKFSRPVRWIVSLLDHHVVEFRLEGLGNLQASNHSLGHRILKPKPIKISSPDSYEKQLKEACVVVDPDERRRLIEEQVAKKAEEMGGKAKLLDGSLLDEVVNITEWPFAVHGEFDHDYLQLPDQLIETIMVHHQRYFPVERRDAESANGNGVSAKRKTLLPHFIAVANNDKSEAYAQIKKGNERVLKARLADGKFFYFDDQKTKLSERKPALGQLTFQKGLGTYLDKLDRLRKLSELVSRDLQLDDKTSVCLEKSCELAKLDLVTNLVRELPELQGYVGAWYAEMEGQPPEIVTAIASHYSPRTMDDAIPADTTGQLVSVLDKLDSLAGLFALGKRPSGSSDPFALRRQAQGLIDTALLGLKEYPLNLSLLIDYLIGLHEQTIDDKKAKFDRAKAVADLHEFLTQRLRGKLYDLVSNRAVVDGILASREPLANLPDLIVRATSLGNLMSSEGGLDVVRSGIRVGNIVMPEDEPKSDPSLFQTSEEHKLWHQFQEFQEQWTQHLLPQCYCNVQRRNPSFNPEALKTADAYQFLVYCASEAEPFPLITDQVLSNTLVASLRNEAKPNDCRIVDLVRVLCAYQYSVKDYDRLLNFLKPMSKSIDSFFDKVMVNCDDAAVKKNRHGLMKSIDVYFKLVADFRKLNPLLA